MGLAISAEGLDRGPPTSRTVRVAPTEAAYGFEPAPRQKQPKSKKTHRRRQQLDWGRSVSSKPPVDGGATSKAMRREQLAGRRLDGREKMVVWMQITDDGVSRWPNDPFSGRPGKRRGGTASARYLRPPSRRHHQSKKYEI